MAQTVREIMTTDPRTIDAGAPVAEAARGMREIDAGSVIVVDHGQVVGILTDRDIVIRAVADGRDPASTPVGEVCSLQVTTVAPDDDANQTVQIMRDRAIRRLPVVEQGRPVGIVSLGDLAVQRDRHSALGDISAAPPNQ